MIFLPPSLENKSLQCVLVSVSPELIPHLNLIYKFIVGFLGPVFTTLSKAVLTDSLFCYSCSGSR